MEEARGMLDSIDEFGVGKAPDPRLDPQFYEGVAARRLAAFCVDVVLILVLGTLAGIVFGVVTLGLGFLLFAGVLAVVDFCYRFFSLAHQAATPGMRLLGLELRAADGEPAGPAEALVHTVTFYIVGVFLLPHLFSLLLMAASPRGRALHDLAAGATLINRPR